MDSKHGVAVVVLGVVAVVGLSLLAAALGFELGFVFASDLRGQHAAPGKYGLPVVIPASRINAVQDVRIPGGAAVYCSRDLTDCIARNLTGVLSIKVALDAHGEHRATVDFAVDDRDAVVGAVFITVCVAICILLASLLMYDVVKECLPLLYRDKNINAPPNSEVLRAMDSIGVRGVFCAALDIDYKNRKYSRRAAYADDFVMMSFTPEDGFRMRFVDPGDEFPRSRFKEVDVEGHLPASYMKERWSPVVTYLRKTHHVCFYVHRGLGIEWRPDGGMRVWVIVDGKIRAYDSVPFVEPVATDAAERADGN